MACQDQQSIFNLVENFTKQGHNYSFYQSIRWLNSIARVCENENLPRLTIKVVPYLSLDFTGGDIKKITFNHRTGVVKIIATFLGLYGTVSPLPTFYTEKIIRNANDNIHIEKDFLDMFHKIFYQKTYAMWAKYKLNLMANEYRDDKYINRGYHLVGLGDKALRRLVPDAKSLLKYAGILNKKTRSIVALEILLKDYFGVNLKLKPSQKIINPITTEQQLNLGKINSSLGLDSYLGQQSYGFGSNLMVDIYDLDLKQLNLFTVKNKYAEILSFLVKFYCSIPVRCFVKLHLKAEVVKNVQLGADKWAKLGQNTWFVKSGANYKTQYFMV